MLVLICRRLPIILLISLSLFSCSSGRAIHSNRELDQAIAFFINGQPDVARQKLESIKDKLRGEDLSTAYLYLGRCYLRLGNLEKAAETFMRGKSRGYESPFDEYLREIRELYQVSPGVLRKEDSMTRAQLAYLLSDYLKTFVFDEEKHLISEPRDIADHWARAYIMEALRKKYMRCLPDSLFHPDENVSRMALFYILSSLSIRSGKKNYKSYSWLLPAVQYNKVPGRLPSEEIEKPPLVSGDEAIKAVELLAKSLRGKD